MEIINSLYVSPSLSSDLRASFTSDDTLIAVSKTMSRFYIIGFKVEISRMIVETTTNHDSSLQLTDK
jgi:hypothetical protein